MTTAPVEPPPASGGLTKRRLRRAALPLLVLGAGALLAIGLIQTAPHTKRQPPARQARLVEVRPVRIGPQRTVVYAMGTVQAAREVAIHPRVSGEIVGVNPEFVPGGRFAEGTTLLQIDPTDYELAVRQRASDVAQAESDLALERGQQSVAQREYELLGETVAPEDAALVLREPQLAKVQATLQAAQAALDQAKLDLARTTVTAPFNAIVRARAVNVGMQVTPTMALATLTGTDEYWVEVAVPVDQLRWIRIPASAAEAGSTVGVYNATAWGPDAHRDGQVVRLLGDLEPDGRMARLLVAVADPLAIQPAHAGQPALLLNDYVRVEIDGLELPEVAEVDRPLVREGDTVWVMNAQDQLEIRPVEILFRGRDTLLIRDNLRDGERLVVTDLAAPVAGMPLRTQDAAPAREPAP
ncbi:efflux RND transporter periplasmic adaptor subunit [bacterium]|nr:efflux RND transporter periplasmic adaptor subunit [bacterium]